MEACRAGGCNRNLAANGEDWPAGCQQGEKGNRRKERIPKFVEKLGGCPVGNQNEEGQIKQGEAEVDLASHQY